MPTMGIICTIPSPGARRAGENGGRADTRWVTLSDEQGAGLAAVTLGEPLQMNASRCATRNAPDSHPALRQSL